MINPEKDDTTVRVTRSNVLNQHPQLYENNDSDEADSFTDSAHKNVVENKTQKEANDHASNVADEPQLKRTSEVSVSTENGNTFQTQLTNKNVLFAFAPIFNKVKEKRETSLASTANATGASGTITATASKQVLLERLKLLRTHSIRLIPIFQTSLAHINAELVNEINQNASEMDKELGTALKKQDATKCEKTSQCCELYSPIAKKLPTNGSKSPNNIKIASPLSSSNTNNDSTSSASQLNDIDDASKRTTAPISCSYYRGSGEGKENADEHGKKSKINLQNGIVNQIDQQQQNEKNNPQQDIQWTLEEDRLLLEQIKSGDLSDELEHQLPNKTQVNIQDRIDFLVDYLIEWRDNKSNDTTTESLLPIPDPNKDEFPQIDLHQNNESSPNFSKSWNFQKIDENIYSNSVKPNRSSDSFVCICKPEDKCGKTCVNRIVNSECNPQLCPCRDKCENTKIQQHIVPPVQRFITKKKEWALRPRILSWLIRIYSSTLAKLWTKANI